MAGLTGGPITRLGRPSEPNPARHRGNARDCPESKHPRPVPAFLAARCGSAPGNVPGRYWPAQALLGADQLERREKATEIGSPRTTTAGDSSAESARQHGDAAQFFSSSVLVIF